MFVGEAPGFHEDKQGVPFVGQAGKLLDQLLGGIGLSREDVYIANVLKCRPPGNRDPQPDEIEACESHLFRQVELIQPKLVAHARELRDEAPLRQADRDHARPRPGAAGRRSAGARCCSTRSTTRPRRCTRRAMLEVLEEDFSAHPGAARPRRRAAAASPSRAAAGAEPAVQPGQLGLF